jgi:hypothetical protein
MHTHTHACDGVLSLDQNDAAAATATSIWDVQDNCTG